MPDAEEAKRLARKKGAGTDEAESAAAVAILEAIERFDLRRKVRFGTYLVERFADSAPPLFGKIAVRDSLTSPSTGRVSPLLSIERRGQPLDNSGRRKRSPGSSDRPRNDRLIIKWLRLDARPKSQAEIARKLGVSRIPVLSALKSHNCGLYITRNNPD